MRRYGQACPLARSLDLVGDRWALLVIRELLLGPRSYKELQSAFQGISTNQLAIRAQELVAQGLISKESRNAPYQLTERGEGLRPAVYELIRWSYLNGDLGAQSEEILNKRWDLLTMRALIRSDPPKRFTTQINLSIGATALQVACRGGRADIELGHGAVSAAHVEGSQEDFRKHCHQRAEEAPQYLKIEGDSKAGRTVMGLFNIP